MKCHNSSYLQYKPPGAPVKKSRPFTEVIAGFPFKLIKFTYIWIDHLEYKYREAFDPGGVSSLTSSAEWQYRGLLTVWICVLKLGATDTIVKVRLDEMNGLTC